MVREDAMGHDVDGEEIGQLAQAFDNELASIGEIFAGDGVFPAEEASSHDIVVDVIDAVFGGLKHFGSRRSGHA